MDTSNSTDTYWVPLLQLQKLFLHSTYSNLRCELLFYLRGYRRIMEKITMHQFLIIHNLIYDIPQPDFLSNKNDIKIPFMLVGDKAFPLTMSMMRPYEGKNFLKLKEFLTIAYHGLDDL